MLLCLLREAYILLLVVNATSKLAAVYQLWRSPISYYSHLTPIVTVPERNYNANLSSGVDENNWSVKSCLRCVVHRQTHGNCWQRQFPDIRVPSRGVNTQGYPVSYMPYVLVSAQSTVYSILGQFVCIMYIIFTLNIITLWSFYPFKKMIFVCACVRVRARLSTYRNSKCFIVLITTCLYLVYYLFIFSFINKFTFTVNFK